MWKDSVEAIGILSLLVLPILIALGVVVSVSAALRAVSRGSHTDRTRK
jgi:hypothetical protein